MKLTDEESYKVQILRGIAIIAVVFIHNTPDGMIQVLCRPFLNFAVALFLFLSGMLSNAEYWNPVRRLKKVVVPYIIWTVVYTILYNYHSLSQLPIICVKNVITGKAAPIMYYIFVYCQFTLLIPLINCLAKSKYKYAGFIFAPVEIVFVRLIPMVMGYQINKYIGMVVHISCLGWFTYYYLGYLIGNDYLHIKCSTKKMIFAYGGGIALQIIEGMWYLSLGNSNCGTQLKLSAVLTGVFALLIAYRFIISDRKSNAVCLRLLGDCSFGIYFSHLAIMWMLNHVPYYTRVWYPFNAVMAVVISTAFVYAGNRLLRKYGQYFAL